MNKRNKPLITVVTVTYNLIRAGREEYFRQCLESVHNQTYENIEHIIIDGASTDGTVELIEEYKNKDWITYISESDNGIYSAMNKGIKRANGKYIIFLNSDDFFDNKEAVGLSIDLLEKENADFSFADCRQLFDDKISIWKGNKEIFLYNMPFSHQTMFTRTSLLKKFDGFKENYKVASDYDLIVKILLNGHKGVYVNDIIVSCRMIGDSQILLDDCKSETENIFKDNFKDFYDFKDYKQVSDLRYKRKVTNRFVKHANKYFNGKQFNNIDIDVLIDNLKFLRNRYYHESNYVLKYLLGIKKKFFPKKLF